MLTQVPWGEAGVSGERAEVREGLGRRRVEIPPGAGTLEVVLPRGTSWEVELELPGAWSPPQALNVPRDAAVSPQLSLRLWPTAELTGRWRLVDPKNDKLPTEMEARFESPPRRGSQRKARGEEQIGRSRVLCPIGEDGRWSCPVPAGFPLDLALRVEGFIPHRRWDFRAARGRDTPFGILTLERGPSLVGWVELEAPPEGKAGARENLKVELLPWAGRSMDPETRARLERPVAAVAGRELGPRGGFQLEGFPPGSYLVRATHPDYAVATYGPLTLAGPEEVHLAEGLVLRPPLEIEVLVEPPVDLWGKPWRLEVWRANPSGGGYEDRPVYRDSIPESGRLVLEGQRPGRYWFTIADQGANRMLTDLDVSINDEADNRVYLEVEQLVVTGRVLLAGEPLAATLWFGGRYGATQTRMDATVEEGYFGTLGRPGMWQVEVEAELPEDLEIGEGTVLAGAEEDGPGKGRPRLQGVLPVRVTPGADGVAEVDLALPDTRVEGWVQDAAGARVPDARVRLTSEAGTGTSVRTDEEGRFVGLALPPGPLGLSASASRGRTSNLQRVELTEGRTVGPVRLVLQETRSLRGTVLGAVGPVAGAQVSLRERGPGGTWGGATGWAETVHTDAEGLFTVAAPVSVVHLAAIVGAPGHGLAVLHLEVPEAPSEGGIASLPPLQVETEAGTLEVTLGGDEAEDHDPGQVLLILHRGVPIFPSPLATWAQGHGVSLVADRVITAPRMAPGTYRVCTGARRILPPEEAQTWLDQELQCAEGSLEAGGLLRLELP